MMTLRKNVILRRSRSGRLEGRADGSPAPETDTAPELPQRREDPCTVGAGPSERDRSGCSSKRCFSPGRSPSSARRKNRRSAAESWRRWTGSALPARYTRSTRPIRASSAMRAIRPSPTCRRRPMSRCSVWVMRRVLDAFIAAAERGIKGAVIYDGGFAEQGEEGRRLQDDIAGDLPRGRHRAMRAELHGRAQSASPEHDLSGRAARPGRARGQCRSRVAERRRLHQPVDGYQALRLQPRRLVGQRGGALRRRLSRIPGRGPAHGGGRGCSSRRSAQPERFVAALDRAAASASRSSC